MKRNRFLVGIVMIIIFISNLQAQRIQNNIYINNAKANQSKDSLVVEMTIDGSKIELPSNESVMLTPVIKTDNNIIELRPVVISGNIRYKADKRTMYFSKDLKNNADPLMIKEVSTISYRQKISYQPWMQNATLYMKQLITGCAECLKAENWSIIGDHIYTENIKPEKPNVKFTVSYIAPETEAVKNRNYEGSAFLDFQVGKSIIIPEFRNNYIELNKIENVLDQLKQDNNATIKTISLIGFASPEGNYQTNNNLSSSRVQSLKVYLQKKYNYTNDIFNEMQGGEDWAKLEDLVSKSDLSDKYKILEIISSSISEDIKEQKLKNLGVTYKILLEEYFPKLRRVDYNLNYVVRAFSIEEGKIIVKTNPAQMSLNEMFLVANSYEKGSENFKDIFDIAVRMYPKDAVANINVAAIALEEGNTKVAHRYLDNYKENAASWNNQGVLCALEGDMERAEEYFKKAESVGVLEATENLKKITLLNSTSY
ncbi:DUF3868 domain-containing protein [Dysgonomonas sp. Marseille-P4677]|uniref:DUF3868 domain-containing protein n=1 Tax=Dysgonomonas sp. Marseille-P4677 TaxID=2364790 RepID=UPI0019117BBC|nr:DUF3868 domain-containing protein [Dysgonomonas sp. Marseille-P4677]MBK5723126.1 DUF3868 domain-containing protein [Dysgonomonas sp. Marseille-P4677]